MRAEAGDDVDLRVDGLGLQWFWLDRLSRLEHGHGLDGLSLDLDVGVWHDRLAQQLHGHGLDRLALHRVHGLDGLALDVHVGVGHLDGLDGLSQHLQLGRHHGRQHDGRLDRRR